MKDNKEIKVYDPIKTSIIPPKELKLLGLIFI